MEEEPQNQAAPATWVCECSNVNSQASTTCEICGLPSPVTQDHIQPQNPSQLIAQPSPQIEEEPSPQIEEEPSPQIEEEETHPQSQDQGQDQPDPSQPQDLAQFKNVYDHGPVQIVATVPNTGDLVPKKALPKVIQNFNREAELIIISQLGIINQGKSLSGNVLNHRLLNGAPFTPFPVGTTTKGLNIFSNPLPLKDGPNTQIVNMDVEGAYGLTDEPPEIQALGLKRLYTLSMILSSVVMIHLGEKPAQSEISLLNEAAETVLLIKSKFNLDLPKIFLLVKEAEDNENYKASIEVIRQRLENQLNPEIMQHIEILPRGKLSDAFLTSNPLDYSKVDQGYLSQMDKILNTLKDYKKKHPILVNQPLKISDFPSIIKELGVGILNNKEYGPYLERSFDYLRSQELSKACQKHLNLYSEECKNLAENPNSLALTIEQFTQQLSAIQTRHRTNFLQEAEIITKKKEGESPLLQSFMSQFDTGMKISSFENVFLQKKSEKEQQQAEKEKYQKKQQEIVQQQEAFKQRAQEFEQDRQIKAEEHKQDMDNWNASHHQLIQKYKAQQAEKMAQLQEQQRKRQQQMEAETAQANANQQQKAREYENQQAQLKKQLDEKHKKAEEDKCQQEGELKKAQQENQQKMEEEKAQINQKLAETEKNAEAREKKRQEEVKKQQEQQAQEQAQMQQQIQEASQDDSNDNRDGGCCNIF